MVLNYHLSKYPALHENLVVKIWEAESDGPGGEIYTQVIPEKDASGVPTVGAGHQVINTISVNGLDKVVHIVRLYSEVSANLLHEFNAEPKIDIVNVFDPIRFKIGDGVPLTPTIGTTTYTNALLIGLDKKEYMVHRNGWGYLTPDVHYIVNSGAGSFSLAVLGDVFGDQEEFLIQRKPSVLQSVANDSVVGKLFGGFIDIAANTSYIPTHLRKLIRFAGVCEYEFPGGGAVPIGYIFAFQHLGVFAGATGKGTIRFSNAPLKWGNTTKVSIDIKSYQEGAFIFDGANWNVMYLSDSTYWNNLIPGQAPNTIVGSGVFKVQWPGFTDGDVPAGDPSWAITHGLNITGDYIVVLGIRVDNPAQAPNSNKLTYAWYHHATDKPNKFNVILRELAAQAQNVSISWTVIKL
jgi:hypothetical protein